LGFGDVWILLDGWNGICLDGARRIWETQHAIYDTASCARVCFPSFEVPITCLESCFLTGPLSLVQYPEWERGTDVSTHAAREFPWLVEFSFVLLSVKSLIHQSKPKQRNATQHTSTASLIVHLEIFLFVFTSLTISILLFTSSKLLLLIGLVLFVDSSLTLVRPFFQLVVS